MAKCYYRVGDNFKGNVERCIDVVQNDVLRTQFLHKMETDATFRRSHLQSLNQTLDEFRSDYNKRGQCPGSHLHNVTQTMVTKLYDVGEIKEWGTEKHSIQIRDGSIVELDCNYVYPWDEAHKQRQISIGDKNEEENEETQKNDDICTIVSFSEAILLKILRRRYIQQKYIYTFVGDVLLSINPYMNIPNSFGTKFHTNSSLMQIQNIQKKQKKHRPSVSVIAARAYNNQFENNIQNIQNQSCIVSGESGAGKTVTSLIQNVSTILEAFGNAKSHLNDNSSRFGKFMKIYFNSSTATVQHYLLEKSRLSHLCQGDRCFHIFYYLVQGATPQEKQKFGIRSIDQYPFLYKGGTIQFGHGKTIDFDTKKMNVRYFFFFFFFFF
eukprot:GSMAST32.ASY1.ANO1.552.1 assembled CDS